MDVWLFMLLREATVTSSGPGGFIPPIPSPAAQDQAWADVDKLAKEFPGWEITWCEYKDGWRFQAKPKVPNLREADSWVIQETADQVREAIRLRETPQGNTL